MNKPRSVVYPIICTILVVALIIGIVIFGNYVDDNKSDNYYNHRGDTAQGNASGENQAEGNRPNSFSDRDNNMAQVTPQEGSPMLLSETATRFEIDISFGNVTITSTTDAPYAVFSGIEHATITSEDHGGTFKLRVRRNNPLGFLDNLLNNEDLVPRIDIYLPAAKLNELKLDIAAGAVRVSDINANEVEIDVSAGSVNVSSVAATSLDAQISAGDLTIENCVVFEFDGDVSAGDLTYYADLTTGDIAMDVTAGTASIFLPAQTSGISVKYEITAGDISDDTGFGLSNFDTGITKKGVASFGDQKVKLDLDVTAGDIILGTYN